MVWAFGAGGVRLGGQSLYSVLWIRFKNIETHSLFILNTIC